MVLNVFGSKKRSLFRTELGRCVFFIALRYLSHFHQEKARVKDPASLSEGGLRLSGEPKATSAVRKRAPMMSSFDFRRANPPPPGHSCS